MPDTFPTFFLYGMLREAGWPRRKGRFSSKPIVDPRFVDSVGIRLMELGMSVGAGRPGLALQLLADVFSDRDWQRQPAIELTRDLEIFSADLGGEKPWEIAWPIRLARVADITKPESMPWEVLNDQSLYGMIHRQFAVSLWWGVRHPDEVRIALDEAWGAVRRNLSALKAWGLQARTDVDVAGAEDHFRESEQMVSAYAAERPLPAVPASFGDIPGVSGRLVTD